MSSSPEMRDDLTTDHLSRFGSIIYSFARIEYLMQATMAAVSGLDDTKVVVLTKSMTYAQKRDTLYSYMVIDAYDAQRAAKIRELFDAAHEYNALRNNIAHALWKPGTRPNSVRPWYLDLRGGRGKIVGMDDDERDYTMDELGDAANALRRITHQIIRFLRESGIAPAIAEKIERINSPSTEDVRVPLGDEPKTAS